MRELADYLDAVDGRRGRELATIPTPAVFAPLRFTQITSALLPIFTAQTPAERATIDAQMWVLDSRWLGSAQFSSMKTCARVVEVGQPPRVQSWYDPSATPCRNWSGALVQPTCDWGFWRIDRCDLETAGTLAFQYSRYLWAQSRMRDLLVNKPRQGVTSAQDAADWLWLASQYISVLLWATNCRFDNPNMGSSLGNYEGAFGGAGLFYTPPALAYDGPATGREIISLVYGGSPVRILNRINNTRLAPTRQSDFAAGAGPLAFMDRNAAPIVHPRYAFATSGGPSPYSSQVPIGVTNEQAEDIRRAAYAIATASGDSDAARWASTKAFNDFWFRATWSWDVKWRPLADVYTQTVRQVADPGSPTGHAEYGWSSSTKTIMLGGASVLVDQMAAMLTHYSAPTLLYTKWMQQAVLTFANDTSGFGPTSPAAMNFINARNSLLQNIGSAVSQEQSLVVNSAGAGYANLAISLVTTILSLIGGIGTILSTVLQGLFTLANQLLAAGIAATGNTPCTAFPFIRVMSPSSGDCNLTTEQITASILGIDSNARWPVSVAGQSNSFAVDGRSFTVTYQATDTTPDLVARRINGAAALVGLGPVASVRNGQVHVEGGDPGAGAARSSGNAQALNFPGTTTTTYTPVVPPLRPAPITTTPGGGGSGGGTGLLLLGAGALLARFLLR